MPADHVPCLHARAASNGASTISMHRRIGWIGHSYRGETRERLAIATARGWMHPQRLLAAATHYKSIEFGRRVMIMMTYLHPCLSTASCLALLSLLGCSAAQVIQSTPGRVTQLESPGSHTSSGELVDVLMNLEWGLGHPKRFRQSQLSCVCCVCCVRVLPDSGLPHREERSIVGVVQAWPWVGQNVTTNVALRASALGVR